MQNNPQPSRRRVNDDFDGAWKNMLSERRFTWFVAFFMPDVFDLIDWTMFQYRYRALDLFGERSLACLAILGDPSATWRPNTYSSSFWGTSIDFEFRTVKLLDFADRLDELEQSDNPFARFVVAHLKTLQTQGDYETRLQWKLRLIQGLYDMGVSEEEIGQLGHDFDWLLALPEPLALRYHRSMTQFEEERAMPHLSTAERIGRREGRREGRQEGKVEGKVEARREILVEQISEKFGPATEEVVAVIGQMTTEQLDRCLRAILTADSLDELGIVL